MIKISHNSQILIEDSSNSLLTLALFAQMPVFFYVFVTCRDHFYCFHNLQYLINQHSHVLLHFNCFLICLLSKSESQNCDFVFISLTILCKYLRTWLHFWRFLFNLPCGELSWIFMGFMNERLKRPDWVTSKPWEDRKSVV